MDYADSFAVLFLPRKLRKELKATSLMQRELSADYADDTDFILETLQRKSDILLLKFFVGAKRPPLSRPYRALLR